MEDINLREMEDERMVAEAYQHLIDTYLASHHRKHTEIIDKAEAEKYPEETREYSILDFVINVEEE